MHRLDRTIATVPACLARYDHTRDTWDDVAGTDKQEIRASLAEMQDTRCAYCEGQVYADGHVEHFRRKNQSHFPHLTFSWDNLFLSCGSEDHCGHYKDRHGAPPYNPDDLIKPDVDDPDTFLYFHSSGEVRPRSGEGAPDPHRAEETIRVFNLDCGPLQYARRQALRVYEKREPGILETLMAFTEEERREFIDLEIQATRRDPYSTVIRHYFEKVL